MTIPRTMSSEYMHWAKTSPAARFNLASSDLLHYPLSGLPCTIDELAITGPGGYGYSPLTEAIAGRYDVDQASVVTTAGTSMANHLAMAAIVEPGDEVLIELPTYELIVSAAEYLGARVIRFPRRFKENFRIDPGEIGRAVTPRTRLIVITNLHNPGSTLTDEETLREVGRIARGVRARVLVDEVYLDAAFDLRPRSSSRLGEEFIATGSLTKVYGLSGLRCGWIFAEPVLAKRIWRLADLFYSTLPHVAEMLAVAAFRSLPAIENRARGLLDANRALFNRILGTRTDLEVHEHTRGLIAFPRLKSGDSTLLCRLLRERYETSVVPGGFFGMPDHIRIGLGGATEEVEGGLRCLAAALDETAGTRQTGQTGQTGQT